MLPRAPPAPSRPGRTPRPPRWALALALLACGLLPGPAAEAADEGEPGARWDVVRRDAIERLHELATWSKTKRLYAGRAGAYELVLAFDPDDEEARARLRYRRGRDGRWTRAARHTPPRDLGSGKAELEERLTAWRAWLLGEVRPLVASSGQSGDGALRCAILRAAIAAAPGDAGLRAANGEVEHEDHGATRWVLAESQVAKERRPQLERIGASVVQGVPEPGFEAPRPDERAEGVAWGQVLTGPHVRVVGTASPPEMDLQYTHCEAIWAVLRATLSLDDEPDGRVAESERPTVYVTKSAEVGNRFLRALPDVEPRELARLVAANSVRLPGGAAVLVKDGSRPWRLEAGPKELVALAVARALGVTDEDAWLAEALAHYVTYRVTGTRQAYRAGDRTETGAAEWLGSPGASVNLAVTDDWLGAGHDLCASSRRPDLLAMAAKDLSTITPDEVLLGYCLVAYWVEGRPDACTRLFRAVGRTPPEALEEVLLAHLGHDLPTVQARLVRWLAETTGRLDRE